MGTRSIVLLRHGQYTADDGRLTPLGREQARAAASHLVATGFDAVWASTLVRAKETAEIVAEHLEIPRVRHVGLLREGLYTKVPGYEVPASERRDDRLRADAAFAKFFRPSRSDRAELLVCHGNLIRYFVCRALHTPIAKWLHMTTNHCAITRILVRGSGAVRVVSYNETGHLPMKLVT